MATMTLEIEVSDDLLEKAEDLCNLELEDVKEMIKDCGVSGLRNYVADMGNWHD